MHKLEPQQKITKRKQAKSHFLSSSLIALAFAITTHLYANQTLSYSQAEQSFLDKSYTSQASIALQEAANLQAQAVKGLSLPRIDLNLRAYSLNKEIDVPLNDVKNNLDKSLTNGVNTQIDQWSSNNPSSNAIAPELKQGMNQGIHDGIGLIPNKYQLDLDDDIVKPTVSVMMPIYTGGLTTNTKAVADLKAQRSQLNTQEQQDLQRFELIQAYFNVQLQKQLLVTSKSNLQGMQQHYENALKLENQGFISKGQRMQFEVAKNNALRTAQNIEAQYKSSLFTLNNLLQSSNITELSTPLFINSKAHNQSLNQLLQSYPEQSTLIQKMQMDTKLADTNIKIQNATKKPNLFAFGEYSLDDKQDWIIGIAAKYNLFSGIDKNKNIQAAELEKYATELATARTKQEIENLIYRSYSEAITAQNSDELLQHNLKAAQENLRIQMLSFKEDMGTAQQVIDAQNMLGSLKAETALNSYKYIMSLATLLQSHGSINQFQTYIHQANTRFIK